MGKKRKRLGMLRETSRSVTPAPGRTDYSLRPSAARRALLMGLSLEAPAADPRTSPKKIEQDSEIVEIVELIDLDDEEAEELMETSPWHVKRWFDRLKSPKQEVEEAEETALSKPFLPNTSSAEVCAANSRPDDPPAEDVRPSVSGMKRTSNRSAREEVCEGSELDSDYDDEFDESAGRLGRDIPDDEELEEPVTEIINAVAKAMDDEADRLLGVSTSYDWVEDFDSFRGVAEVFRGPAPGPIKDYDTPYDVFTDIWSKDIIELIVQETNRYAKQVIESKKAAGTLTPSSRLHQWVDTDADEIMVYLAVIMYMGIDPRSSQSEFWTGNDYLEMPKFKQLLTYNRYILLNKFFHFVDNTDVSQCSQHSEGNSYSAKLAKLKPVISHLSKKFSSLYNLSKNISIDESLTLFKGRLSWVQTIRSKAARFGIKTFELCESRTGYMYKFQIYTGRASNAAALSAAAPNEDLAGKSTVAVLDLLKGLECRGHCVTMDNFYNCPALARYLKGLKFDCLGTLRTNRRNVPDDIRKVRNNMAKGKIIARHCGDVSIVAWKDSKVVSMISTFHDNKTFVSTRTDKELVKPVCVRDYNNTMGGVDLKDQKLSMYLLERKRCVKWYMKMFKRLLNVSIHNAFVMYSESLKRRSQLLLTHREFRYKLAKTLVDRHRHHQPRVSKYAAEITRLKKDVVHEPKYSMGRNSRRRCVVCFRQGINKMVHSSCVTCDEFLCFENCWRKWHSLSKLEGQEKRTRKRRRDVTT